MGIMAALRGLLINLEPPKSARILVPTTTSAAKVNYALELRNAGRLDEAAAIYWDLLQTDIEEVAAAINLGDIWLNQKKYGDAELLLRVMTDKHPDVSALWCNYSAVLSEMGNHELAMYAANQAVKTDAGNPKAFYNRAECWCALNQTRMGIRDFETACQLDPNDMEIREKLELARLAASDDPVKLLYADAKYEPNAHGYEFVDGIEVRATLQCPHCGTHFPSVKGSGIERFFCMHHMALTCGKKECVPCVDFNTKLENETKVINKVTEILQNEIGDVLHKRESGIS